MESKASQWLLDNPRLDQIILDNPEWVRIREVLAELAYAIPVLVAKRGDIDGAANILQCFAESVYTLGYRKGRASTPLTLVVQSDAEEE